MCYSAWADEQGNQNGILEAEEQNELIMAARKVMFEPGEIKNPLDEFFDWDFNGFLDEWENELAQRYLLRGRLRRIDLFQPEAAIHRIPPPDEEMVNIHTTGWPS